MEAKLITLVDRCLPLKTVTMSSRDPAWMSPVVKSPLKKKSRLSCNNKDSQFSVIFEICLGDAYLAYVMEKIEYQSDTQG